MDLTFQEKSLWLMFGAVLVVFGLYFANVLPSSAVNVSAPQVVLFTAVVILLVLIAIVGHIVFAVLHRPEADDERHRLIELRGQAWSSHILGFGALAAIGCALMTEGNFVFTHVLLGFLVIAQLAEYGIQLWLYRRSS